MPWGLSCATIEIVVPRLCICVVRNARNCPTERLFAAENVLALLANYHISVTFFVSGQNARRYPELIKRIAEAGHEIASAGMDDTPMIRQSAEDFQKQLRQSKIILEDLTSQQIVGFRAPHFTIIRETLWALDIIARLGFEYDSSIFPIRHEYFGIPDAPRHMHELKGLEGASLVELPPLTAMLAGQRPAGGGQSLSAVYPCRSGKNVD